MAKCFYCKKAFSLDELMDFTPKQLQEAYHRLNTLTARYLPYPADNEGICSGCWDKLQKLVDHEQVWNKSIGVALRTGGR
jgi:hypothetical protein